MRHCGSCKIEYEKSVYNGYCSWKCRKNKGSGPHIKGSGPLVCGPHCNDCVLWEAKYNEAVVKWKRACEAYVELKKEMGSYE